MSIAKKLKNAGLWQLFQVSIQVIMQFVFVAVTARLLSKDDFGLMAIVSAFIGLGMVFSTSGMGSALIQKNNVTLKHINVAFQASLIMGGGVAAIFYFFADIIALYYDEPKLVDILKVVSLCVFFNSINSISRSMLQKELNFKVTANVTVIITALGYAFGILLAFNGLGVWSLVLSALFISVSTFLVMLYYYPLKLSFAFNWKEFKELFSYGFGIMLLGLNNYLATSGLNLVLGKILNSSMLGVFERIFLLKSLPSQHIGNILDVSMFPILSEIKDDNEAMFRVYQYSIGLTNAILLPLALYLIFFSHEIVLILLGENWLDAILPLQIMLIALPFQASGRMADSIARAKGYVYQNALRKFIFVLVLIPSVAFGASYYSLIGAAVAVTLSYLFNYLMMLFFVGRVFDKKLFGIIYKPFSSAIYLSTVVFSLCFLIYSAFIYLNFNLIVSYFLVSFILALSMVYTAWKKPSYLGFYLELGLKQFYKRA